MKDAQFFNNNFSNCFSSNIGFAMKGNKFLDTLKEYARKLSDDDLHYLHLRFSQRIGADVAEAIELIQQNADMDYWLSLAKTSTDFFDMIDIVDNGIQSEMKRRFAVYDTAKEKR